MLRIGYSQRGDLNAMSELVNNSSDFFSPTKRNLNSAAAVLKIDIHKLMHGDTSGHFPDLDSIQAIRKQVFCSVTFCEKTAESKGSLSSHLTLQTRTASQAVVDEAQQSVVLELCHLVSIEVNTHSKFSYRRSPQ